jgi:hypothetical protein
MKYLDRVIDVGSNSNICNIPNNEISNFSGNSALKNEVTSTALRAGWIELVKPTFLCRLPVVQLLWH